MLIMVNVYDIETYEDCGRVIPYCICGIIGGISFSLYDCKNIVVESLNHICSSTSDDFIEIYIHNLNFDGFIIIEEASLNRLRFEIRAVDTNLYYIKIYYLSKIIFFRCSYKIVPLSLKSLGQFDGCKKTLFPYRFITKETLHYVGSIPDHSYWNESEYDVYVSQNPNKIYDVKSETVFYCMNDVSILSSVLKNILSIISGYSKKILSNSYSAASISHSLYFSKYNSKNILKKLSVANESYVRPSFFGGRCEVYGNLVENEFIKYFDFSGMYAQCMKEKFHFGSSYYDVPSLVDKPGFYTVDYFSDNMYLPVLPLKSNFGKLMFCNGYGTGTFWFEELLYFCEMGGFIKKIHSAYLYENWDFVFTDFVNEFSSIREKGGYYKIFGKLMINSLYGSMALNLDDSVVLLSFSALELESAMSKLTVLKFKKINDMYIITIKLDKKYKLFNDVKFLNNSRNVSYSSAISSKARLKLHKAMISVIKDGGRILYCDTDSIFAAYDCFNKLKSFPGHEWIDFYDDGVFIAPKSYAVKNSNETIIRLKGISSSTVGFDLLKKSFYSDEGIVFKDQLNFKKSDYYLTQGYTEKHLFHYSYDKRIFTFDKKNTSPKYLPG